ncbi:beta-galactosidase GalA [Clostridium grantii]|uniref:Beta-galactosidase n=1 Tax=Clostridium grantii DSM 8605 TaxID=1121316 RepID=A0A1M5U2K5_9CLOT|nr:beta-galactosidase GalA [Clostridium grantii]SHH57194.1 beta-galactosidase [Clostridium grantii DSM 8605]
MREKLLLDFGWRFYEGDIINNSIRGHQSTYMASKAERAKGAATQGYYDEDWEMVDLPHDYVIKGEYDETENSNHGFLPRNLAWYRRKFKLNEEDRDKRTTLVFDGVATYCTVWVNGHLLARNWSGYNSFEVDFTDVAQYGEELNTVAVRVDTTEFEGWWYEGAGIYRHVWLNKTNKISVDLWGTYIHPEKSSKDEWFVPIETTIRNDFNESKKIKVSSKIIDIYGKIITEIESETEINFVSKFTVNQEVIVNNPMLWDVEDPNLYKLLTFVIIDEEIIDEYETIFGFRTIEFLADKGFFLNGKGLKIKGTSNHQDHGSLGVALPDRVHEFRIKRLREMGCNGYRCAHNNPATELLEACDKHGMLVMDENRWFETSEEALKQLTTMAKRDRNHPSIIIWSVGNEEPLQSTEKGRRLVETMKANIKNLDNTRPVTIALNGGFLDKAATVASDIIGINYNIKLYDDVHKLNPDKPIVAPEAGATNNTRGIYLDYDPDKHHPAYDTNHAFFGNTHRTAWREANTRDFIMGVFFWTGIEYRGEANWPKLFAGGGAFDSSGFKKDNFYLLQAMWTEKPMIHILPHWNFKGKENRKIDVWVYTNGDTAELFLNGKSLGEQKIDLYEQGKWTVEYETGELYAISKKKGVFHAETKVETTGEAVELKLRLEDPDVRIDGEDVAIVTVYTVDSVGRKVPTCNYQVEFSTNEAGKIIGVGNGDPSDHDSNVEPRKKMFNGLCQLIVRTLKKQGPLEIYAETKEIKKAKLIIENKNIISRPFVPIVENQLSLKGWRMSSILEEEPDINMEINDNDMNSTIPVEFGENVNTMVSHEKGFIFYRLLTNVPNFSEDNKKVSISFENIEGKARILVKHNKDFWPDPEPNEFCEVVVEKTVEKENSIDIELPGFKQRERIILMIVMKTVNENSGIKGRVTWKIK